MTFQYVQQPHTRAQFGLYTLVSFRSVFIIVFSHQTPSPKTPALQLPIAATRGQRTRLRTLNLNHSMRLTIDADLHACTAVTIMHIGFDPLLWSEVGPVAFGLITALHADDPLRFPVV